MEIPYGYCQCGCGNKTNIPKKNSFKENRLKDIPMKFILGHHVRIKFGSDANGWKGGRKKHNRGYIVVLQTDHPRASSGYVLEHILIAEKVLGKYLPYKVEMHHVNENKSDNRHGNLVVCQDRSYHLLLHRRTAAYKACGYSSWRKCKHCNQYDEPHKLKIYTGSIYHQSC